MTVPLLDATRGLHLLVDPDKWDAGELEAALAGVMSVPGLASIIVGGTFIHGGNFASTMSACRKAGVPVGNFLSAGAVDAMLSADASYVVIPLVLGAAATRYVSDHVIAAAPTIARLKLQVCRVAYLQLDGGVHTSAQFFTQTVPIPRGKPEIISTLSLAANYLGMDAIYLEAGSGAVHPVEPVEVEAAVRGGGLPVLVGGGVTTRSGCEVLFNAGAHGVVIGSAIENRRTLTWLQ